MSDIIKPGRRSDTKARSEAPRALKLDARSKPEAVKQAHDLFDVSKGAEATEGAEAVDARTERAESLLGTLRQQAGKPQGAKLTFGGKHQAVTTTALGDTREYYESLAASEHLVTVAPHLGSVVERFANEVSAPADVQNLIRLAAGADKGVTPEPAAPMGTRQLRNAQTLETSLLQARPHELALSDDSLAHFAATLPFGTVLGSRTALSFLGKHVGNHSPEMTLIVVRMLSRVLEIGAAKSPHTVQVQDWQMLANEMPNSPEGARVYLRLAKAMRADVSNITFHGNKLVPSGLNLPSPAVLARRSGELGTRRHTSSSTLGYANTTHDPKLGQITDDTIHSMWGGGWNWGSHFDNYISASEADAQYIQNWMMIFARGRARGYNVQADPAYVCSRAPQTEEGARALKQMARAFAWDPATLELGGKKLSEWKTGSEGPLPPLKGELGGLHFTQFVLDAALRQGDAAVASVNDPSLLGVAWTDSSWTQNLQGKSPVFIDAAYELLARLKELGVVQFAAPTLPEPSNSPEGIAALRRFVGAWKLDPSTVTVAGKKLSELPGYWPATPPERRAFDAAKALGPDVASPSPYDIVKDTQNSGAMLASIGDVALGTVAVDWVVDPALPLGVDLQLQHFGHFTGKLVERYGVGSPLPLVVMARRLERFGIPADWDAAKSLFKHPIPKEFATADGIAALVRLAKAIHRPIESIQIALTDGSVVALSETGSLSPVVANEVKLKAERDASLAADLAQLDPAKPASPADQKKALEHLLAGGPNAHEFPELMRAVVEARADGRTGLVALGPVEAEKFLQQTMDAIGEPVAAAMLAANLVEIPAAVVERNLRSRHLSTEDAKKWAEVGERIQKLGGRALVEALAARVESYELTTSLASAPVTEERLQRSFDTFPADRTREFMEILVRRAAAEPEGSATIPVLMDFLEKKVLASELPNEFTEIVAPEDVPHFAPQIFDEIGAATQAYLDADPADKLTKAKELAEVIQKPSVFIGAEDRAEVVLGELYARDLAEVSPLAEVDTALGGVPAKTDGAAVVGYGGKTTSVEGIELPMNDSPKRDMKLVPRKEHADMVMTDTTRKNLKLLAAAWRLNRPRLLEGPTSAGKTTIIKYLCWRTGSPMRRINLSAFTEPDDLIGRYVGGEKRYEKKALEKKSREALRAIAFEYGLEEAEVAETTKEAFVELILGVQEKSRWVDGPVVKAMKRGEVLLLDEINLAKPDVIERLNSLFDDDANITVTEHLNEVVERHPNFRAFATMNPASYAGRTALTGAAKSRWTPQIVEGLNQADITMILKARYGNEIPPVQLADLIKAHDALAQAADAGDLGRKAGGVAFTLRNLFRVADRFVKYKGSLPDADLMRREAEEVYRGGLFDPEDIKSVNDTLNIAMRGASGTDFYKDLELKEDADSYTIGDVSIRKINTGHAMTPGEKSILVMTPRTKEILYRLAKALDMGENVALVGERASGKTAIAKMYAHLRGQAYYRQMLSGSTDGSQLIGGYNDRGWQDGLLLEAGRPDGKPGIFLGDEFNLANPALLERLNPVLDDDRKLVLSEKESEEIRLHPDFHFIAAMNPPTREYGGRNKLSKAMQNRFTQIYVPDLEKPEELHQISQVVAAKMGVPDYVATALVDLHVWVRKSYDDETLGKEQRKQDKPNYSIRELLKALEMVSEFQKDLPIDEAFLFAIEAYYSCRAETLDAAAINAKAREIAK